MTIPGVVFQPDVYRGMQRGINQLVDAIGPTLGPRPRIVAIERIAQRGKSPELLDSGGLIARRIVELPGRTTDVGAMFLRHVLWQVHQTVGDGTATTAVLFQKIFNEGVRYVTAGGNAMVLRRHLETGLQVILDELDRMAISLSGAEKLAQMAESVCYDAPMAATLGEIFDLIGEHGRLEIRDGRSREVEREFVDGSYWESGALDKKAISQNVDLTVRMVMPFIFISDLPLDAPQKILDDLTTAKKAGAPNALLIGSTISDDVAGMLHQINAGSKGFQVIAAKTPGKTPTEQAAALADIALLTGGQPYLKDAGNALGTVKAEDFGQARRIWVDKNHLGIVRGQGNPAQVRDHINKLRRAVDRATDARARKALQLRVGRLLGGTAVLWVGAPTESEITMRKALAQRTADTLRGAIRQGMVPGGGAALLACRPAVAKTLAQSHTTDERQARQILLSALEAPLRTIVRNAGFEDSVVIGRLNHNHRGFGFDVNSGVVANMAQAGIWDSTATVKTAVHSAVTGAALALTTDAFVLHRKRAQAGEP
ncbi:MAG: hypothetical protein D6768_13015 [Chloroflexi bacterium]|nr:MAG: hypothetical protein D6768_13015 [Chloroflexota bacterium]